MGSVGRWGVLDLSQNPKSNQLLPIFYQLYQVTLINRNVPTIHCPPTNPVSCYSEARGFDMTSDFVNGSRFIMIICNTQDLRITIIFSRGE